MNLTLDIQRVCAVQFLDDATLQCAAEAVLQGRRRAAELCIRIVDAQESADLNRRFRDQDKPTNVLSFPCDAALPEWPMLGDLVMCAPVIQCEAREQGKPAQQHWSHLVVHGVLHLLGYDHIEEGAAQEMEDIERRVLAGLAIPDPYQQRAMATQVPSDI